MNAAISEIEDRTNPLIYERVDPRRARVEAANLAGLMDWTYLRLREKLRGKLPDLVSGIYEVPNSHMHQDMEVRPDGNGGYSVIQELAVGMKAATFERNLKDLLFVPKFPYRLIVSDDPEFSGEGETFFYFNNRGRYRMQRTIYSRDLIPPGYPITSQSQYGPAFFPLPMIAGDFEPAKVALIKIRDSVATIP